MTNTEIRKNRALALAVSYGVHKMELPDRIDAVKNIEKKYNVILHVEDHCISAWTHRTPVFKWFV